MKAGAQPVSQPPVPNFGCFVFSAGVGESLRLIRTIHDSNYGVHCSIWDWRGAVFTAFAQPVALSLKISTERRIIGLTEEFDELRTADTDCAEKDIGAAFAVRDQSGQPLAYVYYEDEPRRRSAARLLTRD